MRRLLSFVHRIAVEQRAASAVEYGLILAMIVLAMFGALKATATSTISLWNLVDSKVAQSNG